MSVGSWWERSQVRTQRGRGRWSAGRGRTWSAVCGPVKSLSSAIACWSVVVVVVGARLFTRTFPARTPFSVEETYSAKRSFIVPDPHSFVPGPPPIVRSSYTILVVCEGLENQFAITQSFRDEEHMIRSTRILLAFDKAKSSSLWSTSGAPYYSRLLRPGSKRE